MLIATIAVLITLGMIIYPETAFDGAYDGLNIWWNVVFPALLPFFIGAEILMGLGVVRFMGTLLQPIMRPLFNVPGNGSFVMAVGLASGFPLGSILTAKMRRQQLFTKTEAERLICFTNTADPLFMFGAVAVGVLNSPHLGTLIALAHYASSFSVGLIMRFYKKNNKDITIEEKREENILIRALKAMLEAKRKDGRPFGQLMGDAIRNSINTLLLIGGFIVLFSVIISISGEAGLHNLISLTISTLLSPFGIYIDAEVIPAFLSGFFEVSLGCEKAGTLPENISLLTRLMAISAIIGWSGISVHAQVASITSDTDINIIPFICARALHGILAAIYTIPISTLLGVHEPVFSPTHILNISRLSGIETWLLSTSWFLVTIVALTIIILIILLPVTLISGVKFKAFKSKN